ncbi:esterase [Hydrogenophaga crassostreae]|uniref:Esterase n=1 Tax=Hydrogenophaga crassostreae TaxID=1763535 RepID=A0A162P702_9BURK|nr:polyhydroxyalkanoate depolymerase [Hydrogenophaga crassostreae]AOW13668.1 esterase [Hydrogenophaga crassostreae]OAD41964.1 esterase [Hydrogenophaga crassostreae]
MLYQIYETQRSMMEPFADLAEVAAKFYTNPAMPLTQLPIAQRVSAAYDLMHRLGKDYEKPEFGIRTLAVDGVDVAIHERVEVDLPFCELRRFKRFSDDTATLEKLKSQPVVLIVAPLSGHYATLLRDTVRTMLKDHKVYITDWKNARLVPLSDGEFHLDDYVNYVQDFIRYLQKSYGNCHVLSVCQPTVPVLAAISLMATRGETTPLSMTMMGGPIDARKSPTAVNDLAVERSHSWFENNVIYRVPDKFPGAGRRVYPGFLQHTGFVAMNPNRHADSHYDYFKDLIKGDDESVEAHRKFYDEYNAVLDMDADYYLETIATVFQDYKLMMGTWDVKNPKGKLERVRPEDITQTALLTVEGEFDDISGSGQSEAAHKLCTALSKSQRGHYEAKGAGHYGIFAGRRWREFVYPVLHDFIQSHQKAAQAPGKAPVKPAETAAALAKSTAVAPAKRPSASKTVASKAAAKVAAAPAPAKPRVRKPAAKRTTKPAA